MMFVALHSASALQCSRPTRHHDFRIAVEITGLIDCRTSCGDAALCAHCHSACRQCRLSYSFPVQRLNFQLVQLLLWGYENDRVA
jgi:hypothetical protein